MPIPPRYPRALFIACLAVAGAASSTLRADAIPRPTPYRLERRDAAIRALFRSGVARAIIAAKRAQETFADVGSMWSPPKPPAPKLDPRVRAIMNCGPFAALVGPAQAGEHPDMPWVELGENRITIMWRGTLIKGDRVARAYRTNADGREYVGEVKGRVVGTARELDVDRFTEAVNHARDALAAGGFRPSSFLEVRKLKIGRDDDDDTAEDATTESAKIKFKGLVATIGLLRPLPIWATPIRRRGMAR